MPQIILLKLLLLKQCTLSSQRTLVWADLCKRACLSYRLDWQQDVTLFFPRGYILKKQREWLLVYLVELQIVSCSWLKEQKKIHPKCFSCSHTNSTILEVIEIFVQFHCLTSYKDDLYQIDFLSKWPATEGKCHIHICSLHSDLHQHEIKTAKQLTCILFKKILLSI